MAIDAKNTFHSVTGSVTSGIGNALNGKLLSQMPSVDLSDESLDHSSSEGYQKVKEFNTETNIKTEQRNFFARFIDKVAGAIMFGAFAALGVTTAGSSSAAIWAIAGASALMLAGFAITQSSRREQSDKFLDVDDFQNRRLAHYVGKEVNQQQTQEPRRADGKSWVAFTHDNTAAQEAALDAPEAAAR